MQMLRLILEKVHVLFQSSDSHLQFNIPGTLQFLMIALANTPDFQNTMEAHLTKQLLVSQ